MAFFDSNIIIICSGRDSICREATEKWLISHHIRYDHLYMRQNNDNRKDSIVKREMLEEIITKYYVLFSVDDRNQVVNMWRKSGIPCFQVNEGDF